MRPPRQARARGLARAVAVDIRPLRESRHFRLLWGGQLVSLAGRQITTVALPFQVYAVTGSTFAVGALGLVQVVPLVSVGLFGGALADRSDRRLLLLGTNSLLAACSAALAVLALAGTARVWPLYLVAGLMAALSAIDQPARTATVPNLVRPASLAAAMALMFGVFQAALIVGPAAGGFLIAHAGLAAAYLCDVLTYAAAITAVALIPAQRPRGGEDRERPLRAIRVGLRHIRRQRAVLGGFAIDLDAMIFGMPRALFPVLAARTFHTSPSGLGLLYAAPAAGAVLAVLTAGWLSATRRLGRVIIVAVTVWGGAIALFGLVHVLWLGLLLLVLAGAADSVSAVGRSTMIQLTTPDRLRGRVSATYSTVVIGGPYLGDVEAGAVASAFTPAVSVISGGVLCLAGVAVVTRLFPELWRFDTEDEATLAVAPGRD